MKNFEPEPAGGEATGDVAYLRLPLKLSTIDTLKEFIERAYGEGCTTTEEPRGWLKVRCNSTGVDCQRKG